MQRLEIRHLSFLPLLFLFVTIISGANGSLVDDADNPNKDLTDQRDMPDWTRLGELYLTSNLQPLWHQGLTRSDQVESLIEQVNKAKIEGLDPEDYHLSALLSLQPARNREEAAQADALLSSAAVNLAHDLRVGRHSRQAIDPLWRIKQEPFSAPQQLYQSLAKGELEGFFNQLAPRDSFYLALKSALRFYQQIAAAGGWPALPDGPTLHLGDIDQAIPLLRQRLIIEGDYLGTIPDNQLLFDGELGTAVANFQLRHGLEVDSEVGPKTRKVMNTPVAFRIAQLRANLERWRWLPHQLGERYLLVNTAGYEVRLIEDGQTSLVKRSINGKRWRRTPSFSSRITHVVVNPDWTVPKSIAVRDLLPLQRRNSQYLASKNIDVLRKTESGWSVEDAAKLDWDSYNWNHFPFTLRQHPGDHNSLGKLKFYMPNPYNIYLHDTPSRELFDQELRAFSSGCIRVEHPLQLAEMLMGDRAQSLETTLAEQIASGETLKTSIPKPVPVYLVYLTSWVDELGAVQFRPDSYRLNKPLIQALHHQDTPPAPALAYHTEAVQE
ncbi:MAG: L,D-transpeptidase family protein [Candidatus Sedimenticola sp. (ex Thyasira tokunagai)]